MLALLGTDPKGVLTSVPVSPSLLMNIAEGATLAELALDLSTG